MHGLNSLYNINVRHQRLDNINNNDDRQHYNHIDIHHLIATSYNHQHIYIPSCNNSLTKLFIQNKAIRTDNIILSFQVCTKG